MGDTLKRLEERIERVKSDALARRHWFESRRKIEEHGGRWRADDGVVFELVDGAIHQYLADIKEGVSQLVITAMDAEVPYVASLEYDLQGTPPKRRKALLQELAETAKRAAGQPVETITIVKDDWLTKLSLARWGTLDWNSHLHPTELTENAREIKGKSFDPNLIYPGDTFRVTT